MGPSLQLAQEAKDYTRGWKITSGNKRRPGWSEKKGWDRGQRQAYAVDNLRLMHSLLRLRRSKGVPLNERLKELADSAVVRRSGNCTELAAIAYFYLVEKDVRPVRLLGLKEPGDHVFVGLGHIGDVTDVDRWGPDTFICDPWANIACPAAEYKTRWLAKMTKWSGDGKTLVDPTQDGREPVFVNPLGDQWAQAITRHEITQYLHHPA